MRPQACREILQAEEPFGRYSLHEQERVIMSKADRPGHVTFTSLSLSSLPCRMENTPSTSEGCQTI